MRYAAKAGSNMMMDTAMMATVPVCMSGKVSCHALDTTDIVMGELTGDDIHPLLNANDRMAQALVAMMQKEGMRR